MSVTCSSLLPHTGARQEIRDAEDVRVGVLMQGVRQGYLYLTVVVESEYSYVRQGSGSHSSPVI
jgi:hypothetical protein